MKKCIVSLLVIFFVVVSTKLLFAQEEFNYDKAYQDYTYNLSLYDTAHNDYELAREQYLQYQTLTAENEAKDKTLAMLLARDEVVKTYLTAIRMKLKETPGISDTEKNSIYTRIDTEFKWYSDHKDKLPSAGTLDDLITDADAASQQYESTKIVIYSVLTSILNGKVTDARQDLVTSFSELKDKVTEIRHNQDKDVSSIERSFPEIDNKITRSQGKQTDAVTNINTMKLTGKDKSQIYSDTQGLVEDAYLYLKEGNTFLLEVVRQLKTS